MSTPRIVGTDFGGPADAPLVLLGPSLGTSADTLWSRAAPYLRANLRVVAWDLPGHGRSPSGDGFAMADLAAGVGALADRLGAQTFHYAGDSVGGCVGLQLLLDAPHRVATATLLCTGASIGSPDGWRERAAAVRARGIAAVYDTAATRWFGGGFTDRHPETATALLGALRDTDPEGYAQTCDALGGFAVTSRLADVAAPVLAIAGAEDLPTPPESLRVIVSGVKDGRLEVLEGVGHLAPAEAPARVGELIAGHCGVTAGRGVSTDALHDAGMAVRRAVLGDAHVDRAVAARTDLIADF
jgi:3-oxoadipate enol-lactonase/4-carboxymuconolactone decarboxylase